MKHLLILLVVAIFCSCTHNSEIEKYQSKRDNIVNVKDRIKDVDISDITMNGAFNIYIMNDYLIIDDFKSFDKHLNICDKNTFKCIARTAPKGRGPGEIIRIGHIGVDEINRVFYVTDHGKNKIFRYELDSVLSNPKYQPIVKMEIDVRKFMAQYQFINDTLSIGRIIEPTDNSGFKQSVAKWNMNTGEIDVMKYQHPDIDVSKKRVGIAASPIDRIYVEAYGDHDLLTICNFDGKLMYNIYGHNWNPERTKKAYFEKVIFCNDRIVVLYKGDVDYFIDENNQIQKKWATKFLVFDINGNYIKTLETKYSILTWEFDKDNNRILMVVNEGETTFAYLDLDGLLD